MTEIMTYSDVKQYTVMKLSQLHNHFNSTIKTSLEKKEKTEHREHPLLDQCPR